MAGEERIKIAIAKVGNCTSSLLKGIKYYRKKDMDSFGLMHWEFGGYLPYEIEVVAAFNINQRKVGKNISEAIFSFPNCIMFFLFECSTDRDKGKCRLFQKTESKTGKYLST